MDIKGLDKLSFEELQAVLNANDSSDDILKEIERNAELKEAKEKELEKLNGRVKKTVDDNSKSNVGLKKKSLGYYAKKAGSSVVKNSNKLKILTEFGLSGNDATEDAFLVTSLLQTAQNGNIQALNAYREITKDALLDEADQEPFYLPAKLIASSFVDLNRDIDNGKWIEVACIGGRGSTKSTYISEKIIEFIKNNPKAHSVIFRQVKDTLKNSVFAQMLWAIDTLELTKEFKATKNPLEITYLPTGQKILFYGADDKATVKGIKLPFGYIGVSWFEEFDQFKSAEDLRNIRQSLIRGSGSNQVLVFMSMNPPKSSRAWVNKFILDNENIKPCFTVHRSDYRTVPKEWLGDAFIMEAEMQKKLNPTAYNHEYLGEVTGAGDNVFDNIFDEEITDEMINNFGNHYYGADFGFKDATAFNAMSYDVERKILYIYDEFHKTHLPDPSELLEFLHERGYKKSDLITADSHDADKIAFMRNYGYTVNGAHKIKGVKTYGYNFLVGLTKIVVDKKRCPYTYQEFYEYHHNLNKYDELINDYPEGQEDHHMSSVIYALERIWKRQNAWRGTNKYEEYLDSLE